MPVPLGDAGRLSHRLDERPERDAVPVGKAAPAQRPHVSRLLEELVSEPRLADARLAEHRDRLDAPPLLRPVARFQEERELFLAADHGRLGMPEHSLLVLCHRDEAVGGHALGLALELERLDLFDLDRLPDEPVGRLADENLECRRRLLEPRCDVDRVAGDEPLTRGGVPGDDLTRVHAGPVRELDAPALLELAVQLRERLLHREGGPDSAKSVVLVDPRQAEDGHDRVADVLLHRSAVMLEDLAHLVEVARHHLAQRFRIERLAKARRAFEVGEDDGDCLPYLLRRKRGCEGGAAKPAEPEAFRVLLTAVRTGLHAIECRDSVRNREAPPYVNTCASRAAGRR